VLFSQLLEAPPSSDTDARGFSVRLAFARHLSPAARVRLLERRRLELNDRLLRADLALARPPRALDAYERSIAEHARESVASDLTWIERLLESEHRDQDDRHLGGEVLTAAGLNTRTRSGRSRAGTMTKDGRKG
jgi:hypothetical protein